MRSNSLKKTKDDTSKYIAKTKQGWSPEEEMRLEELAADHTDDEIKDVLNKEFKTRRTYPSVVNKRQALGVAKFARQKGTRKRMIGVSSANPRKIRRNKTQVKQSVFAKVSNDNIPSVRGKYVKFRVDDKPVGDTLAMLVDAVNAGFRPELDVA